MPTSGHTMSSACKPVNSAKRPTSRSVETLLLGIPNHYPATSNLSQKMTSRTPRNQRSRSRSLKTQHLRPQRPRRALKRSLSKSHRIRTRTSSSKQRPLPLPPPPPRLPRTIRHQDLLGRDQTRRRLLQLSYTTSQNIMHHSRRWRTECTVDCESLLVCS